MAIIGWTELWGPKGEGQPCPKRQQTSETGGAGWRGQEGAFLEETDYWGLDAKIGDGLGGGWQGPCFKGSWVRGYQRALSYADPQRIAAGSGLCTFQTSVPTNSAPLHSFICSLSTLPDVHRVPHSGQGQGDSLYVCLWKPAVRQGRCTAAHICTGRAPHRWLGFARDSH